jgi:hypothetical protein
MDEYRRGTQVTREREKRRNRVTPLYRRILPVLWAVGTVLFLFFAAWRGPAPSLAVVVVMHVFFAGLIRGDIRALRRQGLEWGFSRHVWFAAALVLPFVALVYYVYSGRRVRRVNEERGVA